jgi:hypothetical protein
MKNLNMHFKMTNTKYLHDQKIDLPRWCTCNIYDTPHFEGNCTVGNPLVTPNKTCLVYDITRYCKCWWQSCRPYPSKLLYHTYRGLSNIPPARLKCQYCLSHHVKISHVPYDHTYPWVFSSGTPWSFRSTCYLTQASLRKQTAGLTNSSCKNKDHSQIDGSDWHPLQWLLSPLSL